MMNGGSTGRYDTYDQKLDSYASKNEIFKEIKNLCYSLSEKKDFCKNDCMKALSIIDNTLFDKLDKINKK